VTIGGNYFIYVYAWVASRLVLKGPNASFSVKTLSDKQQANRTIISGIIKEQEEKMHENGSAHTFLYNLFLS
jgi:hypothetical protein